MINVEDHATHCRMARKIIIPGEPGRYVFRDPRAGVSINETFEVRFEPVSDDAKFEGATH